MLDNRIMGRLNEERMARNGHHYGTITNPVAFSAASHIVRQLRDYSPLLIFGLPGSVLFAIGLHTGPSSGDWKEAGTVKRIDLLNR